MIKATLQMDEGPELQWVVGADRWHNQSLLVAELDRLLGPHGTTCMGPVKAELQPAEPTQADDGLEGA